MDARKESRKIYFRTRRQTQHEIPNCTKPQKLRSQLGKSHRCSSFNEHHEKCPQGLNAAIRRFIVMLVMLVGRICAQLAINKIDIPTKSNDARYNQLTANNSCRLKFCRKFGCTSLKPWKPPLTAPLRPFERDIVKSTSHWWFAQSNEQRERRTQLVTMQGTLAKNFGTKVYRRQVRATNMRHAIEHLASTLRDFLLLNVAMMGARGRRCVLEDSRCDEVVHARNIRPTTTATTREECCQVPATAHSAEYEPGLYARSRRERYVYHSYERIFESYLPWRWFGSSRCCLLELLRRGTV